MAPGSKPPRLQRRSTSGFTLLELMIVVALIAVATGVAVLALRDANASRLEEEAARLSALFEAARARSRATGQPVNWLPVREEGDGFAFTGLGERAGLPTQWLDARTRAEVIGAPLLRLGPEPVIGAQRVALRLEDRQVVLATDGLAPFAVLESGALAAR
ncbi:pilus assembly FimT family protein [Ideonella aquatica]|uniref:pilus assembly FimT family protein n=1 Tax=Ideonella aquatica TaxID=2824119 RepID=UPI001FFD5EFE|nr:prepilin-type N-terminal cleavage/methylation domain-containing protein [Ideonella aquatica]